MTTFLKKLLLFSLSVAVLLVVQYRVDPFDVCPDSQLLPPILPRSRERKVEGYLHSTDRDFDAIILGSSRAMHLDARYVGSYGYRCYDFGVTGCRTEDCYAILGLVSEHNTVPLRLVILSNSIRMSPVSLWRHLLGTDREPRDRLVPENGKYATTPLPRLDVRGLEAEVYYRYYGIFSSF
ncbi:hypothetical protein KAU45_05250, partial [bacterium]|nr:hypothetical protein [bacterium]